MRHSQETVTPKKIAKLRKQFARLDRVLNEPSIMLRQNAMRWVNENPMPVRYEYGAFINRLWRDTKTGGYGMQTVYEALVACKYRARDYLAWFPTGNDIVMHHSTRDLAEALGMSPRTVQGRMQNLVCNGFVRLIRFPLPPWGNFSLYHVWVPPKIDRGIRQGRIKLDAQEEDIQPYIQRMYTPGDENMLYSLFGASRELLLAPETACASNAHHHVLYNYLIAKNIYKKLHIWCALERTPTGAYYTEPLSKQERQVLASVQE